MSEYPSFSEVTLKFFEYHGKEEHQQAAYDLITEAAPHFPDRAALLYNWRYCAAALLNKPDLAIEIFQEAIAEGFWWSEEYLRSDEDLKSLQNLPAFNQLVDVCEQRYQTALSEAAPVSLSLPLPTQSAEALPLLLALHGNSDNADNSVSFWESAVKQGWLTVLLQSSQVVGPQAYVWNDLELGAREIQDHCAGLAEEYQINSEQLVIGGFSKGGEMAIWATLTDSIPVNGFIAVCPGGPYIEDINRWRPILENSKVLAERRGYFVVGENDPRVENIKALHDMLVSEGMACKLVIAPGIDHAFPADFDQTLARALQYLR
jgi:hypothetical protein